MTYVPDLPLQYTLFTEFDDNGNPILPSTSYWDLLIEDKHLGNHQMDLHLVEALLNLNLVDILVDHHLVILIIKEAIATILASAQPPIFPMLATALTACASTLRKWEWWWQALE